MNDPQLTNVLISIIGALIIAALGWLTASHRGYRKDQMSLRAEIRTEFTAVNTRLDHSTARADELNRRIDHSTAQADARADELSRRIDHNGRRLDDNGRRLDDNGRRIDRLANWIATLAERLTRLEIRVDPQARPPSLEELPPIDPPPAEQEPPPAPRP